MVNYIRSWRVSFLLNDRNHKKKKHTKKNQEEKQERVDEKHTWSKTHTWTSSIFRTAFSLSTARRMSRSIDLPIPPPSFVRPITKNSVPIDMFRFQETLASLFYRTECQIKIDNERNGLVFCFTKVQSSPHTYTERYHVLDSLSFSIVQIKTKKKVFTSTEKF